MIPNALFIKCFDILLFYLLQLSYESVWQLFPWEKAAAVLTCMHVHSFTVRMSVWKKWVNNVKTNVPCACICPFIYILVKCCLQMLTLLCFHTGEKKKCNILCWALVFIKFHEKSWKQNTLCSLFSDFSPCNLKAEVFHGTEQGWVVNLGGLLKLWSSVGEA